MGPLYDQVGGDGGLPSSTSNNMNNNNERKSGFRKYALLIQDSLAIKFVPVTPTESPHFPHANQYYSAVGTTGNHPTVGFSNNGNPIISDNPHESISNNNETSEKSVNKRDHISLSNNKGGGTTSTGGLLRSSRGLLADRTSSTTSVSRDVDHSLHALYLFKESNLKCYWNGGLSETIRNIEYKGYIVPSIILVTALPRYLTILRTAWSRRMLRSPPGYRIKFIGEVEELVAEPIGQGQFAPLSDSLCWAILELTSIGEEAFVDPIMAVLKGKFPSMSCPSRELVFQTLEKLIRERKIYQTANGYFVVTPDTFRFMTSAAPQHLFNPSINLDALIPYDDTPDKSLHNPWESHQLQSHPKDVTGDKQPVTNNESTMADSTPSNGNKLKRHSSLKTFRQRDICDAEAKESFGRRGISMRLSKSLSCDQLDKDNDKEGDEEGLKSPKIGRRSTLSQITTLMRNFKMNVSDSSSRSKRSTKLPALDRNTKGKSLFSRLFGRSRSKSREPRELRDEISSPANTNGAITVEAAAAPVNITTTLVPVSSDEASSSSAHSSPAHVRPDTTDSALYDVLSDPSTSSSMGDNNNKLSSLDQQDNLHDDDHNHHHTSFPVPANFPSFHSRDEPSRCSTLSHATSSLGYGSEGYPSLNLSSPSSTHSPCPYESLRNTSTRHSINNGHGYSTGGMKASKRTTSTADFYQRRYPSYSHSFSRNSPYYASLTSPTRIKVPTHSLYDSLLTTTSSSQSTPKSNEFSKPYGDSNNHNHKHMSETTGMNETKVTQTVKSTTDMELQLLLPLGNIMKAAINAKKQELKDNFFREEFRREPPPQTAQQSQNRKSSTNSSHDQERDHDIPIHLDKSSGIKLNVSEPKSQTEIKTKIDKNGVVEEHYQTLPNVDISNTRSKVEININGKSLDFGWTNHNGKIRKISTQPVEQETGTDSLSPSPHMTSTPTTCGQFESNSINGNGNQRTSKWSTLGGVTLCNNVGQGFQDDIKVSII